MNPQRKATPREEEVDVAVMLANNEEGLISQMFGVFIQVGESKFLSLVGMTRTGRTGDEHSA
jgi:hypothetical protein